MSGLTQGTTQLTAAQAAAKFFYCTGTLTGNVVIAFPPIGGGVKYIFPGCTMNGFGIYVRGNNGADQNGVFFLNSFAIPYGILVTPNRVYWDYGGCPVGSLGNFAMGFIHDGWIPCDGRGISNPPYDLLVDLIGGNVPDFRGLAIVCADNIGTGSAGRLGPWAGEGVNGDIGEAYHTLSTAEMPSHNHGDYGHGHGVNDNGHAHSYNEATNFGLYGGNYPSTGAVNQTPAQTSVSGAGISIQTGYANISYSGGGAGHNTIQPSRTVLTCIRW